MTREEVVKQTVEDKGFQYIKSEFVIYGNKNKRYVHIMDAEGYMYRVCHSSIYKNCNFKRYIITSPYIKHNLQVHATPKSIQVQEVFSKNGKSWARLKCKNDGYEWETKVSDFVNKNRGCPRCNGCERYNIKKIQDIIDDAGINWQILSADYKNKDLKLDVLCFDCNTKFKKSWHDMQQRGFLCPVCDEVDRLAFYSIENAEQYKEDFLNVKASVYIIKVFNKEESFFKIGITKNSLKERFSTRFPYQFEQIKSIQANLYDCVYIEKKLHEMNERYFYLPKLPMCGKTECFSDLRKEVLDYEYISLHTKCDWK